MELAWGQLGTGALPVPPNHLPPRVGRNYAFRPGQLRHVDGPRHIAPSSFASRLAAAVGDMVRPSMRACSAHSSDRPSHGLRRLVLFLNVGLAAVTRDNTWMDLLRDLLPDGIVYGAAILENQPHACLLDFLKT